MSGGKQTTKTSVGHLQVSEEKGRHVEPIFNLLDIENEPTDEQLAQLMTLVRESVIARARKAEAEFQARFAEEMRRAIEDVARIRASAISSKKIQ
jgi:hypothetical protein